MPRLSESDALLSRPSPRAGTTASVVVPAHDEAAVIERCLEALLADAHPGEFDVVVAANGCHDDTADRARAAASRLGQTVRVLELPCAGKAGALRAGDAVVAGWPRIYLDADVLCPSSTLRDLVLALAEPGVELAVPTRVLSLQQASRPARLYYETWAGRPKVRAMLSGRGCYALSAAGRQRVGDFPDRVADDRYVTTAVPRSAARVVAGAVRVRPPQDLRAVLAVRTRIYAGNAQLGQVAHVERGSTWLASVRELGRPADWPGLAVYAAVTLLAKLRARRVLRAGEVPWGRDTARGVRSGQQA